MNIEQKVIEIIKNNSNVDNITKDNIDGLKFNQLGINSLNFIKIVVELEDSFGIEFNDDQINYELMNNITNLIELIKTILNSK